MNDIELRWVQRQVDGEFLLDGKRLSYQGRFLQYRKQIRNTSASNELSGLVTEWSEWIDVPTVEE